jgi:hypothetical protein
VKGHIPERSPGRWALHDPEPGKRNAKFLGLQIFHNVERADPDSEVSALWSKEFRPDVEMAVLALSDVRRDLNIPFTSRKKDPQQ